MQIGVFIAECLLVIASAMFTAVAFKIIFLITEIVVIRILLCIIVAIVFNKLFTTIVDYDFKMR